MRKFLIFMGVCLLAAILGTAAYASISNGTENNDWGPLSEHQNFPLPNDCGPTGGNQQGELIAAQPIAADNTVTGKGGCDYIRLGDGADTARGNEEMDTLYGGSGNDTLYGNASHDHLFGEDGNDYLQPLSLDGSSDPDDNGHIEEVRCGNGSDKAFLKADPDGVYFSECELINGYKPVINGVDKSQSFVNTEDGGNAESQRGAVNDWLRNHGG